jgi:hypothetical protein
MGALRIITRTGDWNGRALFFAAILLSCSLLGATVSADVTSVEALEFTRVQLVGSNELEITQGDVNTLKIKGGDGQLSSPPFVLQGDLLRLGVTADGDRVSDVKFKLSAEAITQVLLMGSGDVFVKPLAVGDLLVSVDGSGEIRMFDLKAGALELQVSGSGSVQAVSVSADSVRLNIKGSGDIQLGSIEANTVNAQIAGSGDVVVQDEGRANVLEVAVMGSGDVAMKGVAARVGKVTILGSGDVEVRVSESLEAEIFGSGDLLYYGEPETSTSVMGSGEVTRKSKS